MKNSFIDKLIWVTYLIGTITIVGLVVYGIMYFFAWIDVRYSNKCIENGGIVIADKFGYFDRCIYGG